MWRPGRYACPFVGVGALGGFTTFSTFSFETLPLLDEGAALEVGLSVIGTLVAGVAAASGAYAAVLAVF